MMNFKKAFFFVLSIKLTWALVTVNPELVIEGTSTEVTFSVNSTDTGFRMNKMVFSPSENFIRNGGKFYGSPLKDWDYDIISSSNGNYSEIIYSELEGSFFEKVTFKVRVPYNYSDEISIGLHYQTIDGQWQNATNDSDKLVIRVLSQSHAIANHEFINEVKNKVIVIMQPIVVQPVNVVHESNIIMLDQQLHHLMENQNETQSQHIIEQFKNNPQALEMIEQINNGTQNLEIVSPIKDIQSVDNNKPIKTETQTPIKRDTQAVDIKEPIVKDTQVVDVKEPIESETQGLENNEPIENVTEPAKNDTQNIKLTENVAQYSKIAEPVKKDTQSTKLTKTIGNDVQVSEITESIKNDTQNIESNEIIESDVQGSEITEPVKNESQAINIINPVNHENTKSDKPYMG